MMQHVPAVKMTLIDVEREAMESVFLSLQGMEIGIPLLLNPSKEVAERYITNRDVVIIRPLVKEAPTDIVNGCPVPTLEKCLSMPYPTKNCNTFKVMNYILYIQMPLRITKSKKRGC